MPENTKLGTLFRTSHAFLIGINEYEHVNPLKTAVKDASDIAEILGDTQKHGYSVHLLTNPGKKEIEDFFAQMKALVHARDRVIFYFAGHGIALNSGGDPEGFIVPADADPRDKDSLISMDLLHDTLNELPCKHGLLILDCCFAGSFKWSTDTRAFSLASGETLYAERFWRFVQHPAWQVITSSAHNQKASDLVNHQALGLREEEMTDTQNSPFAWAFKQAIDLHSKADISSSRRSDGIVTTTELFLYLREIVLDATQYDNHQSPALFTLRRHDTKGEFIFLNPGHKLNLPEAPDHNPYKGLLPYEATQTDAKTFFGRDQAIKEMEIKLEKTSVLVVSAPSGQGKSSVVKAGLFPALYQKQYPRARILRPGDRVPEDWEALQSLAPDPKQLVLIDQYEELFGLENEERAGFEQKLTDMIRRIKRTDNPGLKLILTIRSDFEWQLSASVFGQCFWREENIRNFLYRLPPMSTEELREIMVNPAWVVAYEFESEELINQILEEINHAPGALPLLSFALSQLYEKRDQDERLLTRKAYEEELGGVNGALSKYADGIYAQLADRPAHQDFMRKLMLRMVRLNDGPYSRRRIYLKSPSNIAGEGFIDELNYPDHLDATKDEVLKILEDAFLVSKGQDQLGPYVEPMHDSLLNFWPRCLQWIQDFGKENLVLQRQIWQAVLEHHRWSEPLYANADGQKPGPPLWDNNPKLQQIQTAVSDPKDEWLCKKGWANKSISSIAFLLWEREPTAAQREEMAAWNWFFQEDDPEKRYQKIQAQMDHWLNEEELAFVQASFEAQRSELERVRAERNEAIRAKEQAEEQTRIAEARRTEAEALAISINARNMPRSEMMPALQLAKYAYAQKVLPEVSQTLSALFYEQFGGEDGVRLPLFAVDLHQHPDRVASAGFSSDGQSFFTAYGDGTAKLWSLQGKMIREIPQPPDPDESVIISPNGELILEISEDGIVRLKNSQGKLQGEWNTDIPYLESAIFSPNGQFILTFSDSQVKLWNLQGDLKMTLDPDAHNLMIYSVVFSPDGEHILTASMDKTAKLWDLQGNLIQELNQHTNEVYAAIFSPDGQLILTASRDGTAKLWNREGTLLADLNLHTDAVNRAIFSPDGKYILTTSWDNTVKLWCLQGELVVNFPTHTRPWTEQHTELENSAIFSPDGQYILSHFGDPYGGPSPGRLDNATRLWSRQGELLVDWNARWGYVGPAVFSPDGEFIYTPASEQETKVWNLDGEAIAAKDALPDYGKIKPVPRDGIGNARIYSADKLFQLAFSEEVDHVATLWNNTGEQIAEMNQHTARINSAVFSPDGQFILTASWDKTAKLWNMKGELIANLDQHTGSVKSAIFSPDGQYILTTSIDQTAKLWNLKGELLADLDKHQGYLDSALFSADSQFILTASYDGTAKLWPVPERIFQHMETELNIPELSEADKKKYRIS
jgi:WD40 repeat protein/energy-coupling factor transporter ATP-binding protein EcfA2